VHFLVLRKSDAVTEAGKHAVEPWLDTVLHPSAMGVLVQFRDGRASSLVSGPLPNTSELVAGFSTVEAATKDEAVAIIAQRLNEAGDDPVEVEVREAGCPGGMAGVEPIAPDSGLTRFVIMLKSKGLELGFIPGPELLARMSATNDHATAAGLMLAGDGLMPSVKGARVRKAGRGRMSVIDGPFAESKELVAGYWLIQAASIEDAIRWVSAYPYPVRDCCDVEIRPVL